MSSESEGLSQGQQPEVVTCPLPRVRAITLAAANECARPRDPVWNRGVDRVRTDLLELCDDHADRDDHHLTDRAIEATIDARLNRIPWARRYRQDHAASVRVLRSVADTLDLTIECRASMNTKIADVEENYNE